MDYGKARHIMVEQQLRARGVKDERVLYAMESVPRHLFVDPLRQPVAYDDCALPIGEGQTISQPFMVAAMTELLELKGKERVLEIGTGSGYQAAILSVLASEVYSVERIRSLSENAAKKLNELEYRNVILSVSDGTQGLPEHAPYDAIIVAAGAPSVPQVYIDQLKDGGRLVIPVGSRYSQVLYQVRKRAAGIEETVFTACVFVPLIGRNGWRDQ